MEKTIGIVGLGKMGSGLAKNLAEKGWNVVAWNRTVATAKELEGEFSNITAAESLEQLVQKLPAPRVVWLMVPAGKVVDDVLFGDGGLGQFLQPGDTVIDGGNSFFEDDAPRAKQLEEKGIAYLDAGVSGGPHGARTGACIMVGGLRVVFDAVEPVFTDAAMSGALKFFEGAGAGHFVKMVHNGIEYGMMQALAEGFHVLKASPFNLNLTDVADLYNHGSVIESRLVGWIQSGFQVYGEDLDGVSGVVAHTGEGAWTVKTADKLGVATDNIKQSLDFRLHSSELPDYTGQMLSMMRNQFGGHAIDTK